jgi:hypothetical protein
VAATATSWSGAASAWGGRSCGSIPGKSGASYQVEVEGFWDSGRPGDLRVMVAMDDGGFSAFRPLTVGFIVRPDGTFVGR